MAVESNVDIQTFKRFLVNHFKLRGTQAWQVVSKRYPGYRVAIEIPYWNWDKDSLIQAFDSGNIDYKNRGDEFFFREEDLSKILGYLRIVL